MSLLSDAAAEDLRTKLERHAYRGLFSDSDSAKTTQDPWGRFTAARDEGSRQTGGVTTLASLFLGQKSIPIEQAADALGAELVHDLTSTGFLESSKSNVSSPFCILFLGGAYVVIDFPSVSGPNSRLVATDTYLSGSTLDLLHYGRRVPAGGSFLEAGCGTALASIVAAKRGLRSVAVDLDERALSIAQANARLNGVPIELLRGDLFAALAPDARFDAISFNPPWRLVPPDVDYPNRMARVGRGFDGLDMVREFVRHAPSHLVPGGIAVVRFDMPCADPCRCPFLQELRELRGRRRFSMATKVIGRMDIATQSRRSAETAAYLNPTNTLDELVRRFELRYRQLGCSVLWRSLLEITNDDLCAFSLQDDASGDVL